MTTLVQSPAREPHAPPPARVVSPLLPVLVPLVIAAIVSGVLLAWMFPRTEIGGIAPNARFVDITAESGLVFAHHVGLGPPDEQPTTLGAGLAVLDFDGDGDDDIFLTNGAAWPWEEWFARRVSTSWPALFRNDGTGHFTDVTQTAGLTVELQSMSATAGDFDNDGHPDLFVTCVGTDHLYRNRGNGTFEDVTDSAGVGGEDNSWSTGATWIDYDNDGLLDLVVCLYARWPQQLELVTAFGVAAMGHSYGTPTGFIGAQPVLYRNLGNGAFSEVPGSAGLRDIDPQTGLPVARALAVAPVDANGDGMLDLLFSYHTHHDALFLNGGDGTFRRWSTGVDDRREGLSAGLALSSPLPFARAASADTRFAALQAATLPGLHPDSEAFVQLGARFGVAMLDYDLDGRPDLFTGRGRAEPGLNRFELGRDFASSPALLWNRGNEWIPAPANDESDSPIWTAPLRARGVATADFDGDGDGDVVISQSSGPTRLLRNDQRTGMPWLQVRLVARRGVREALGARVELHTPRRVLVQSQTLPMGLFAQSTSMLSFGLGEDARVRKIVVVWPDGTRQEIRPEGINRRIVIEQQ